MLIRSNIFLMYFLILGLAIVGSGVFGRAHFAQYNIRGIEVNILLGWMGVGGTLSPRPRPLANSSSPIVFTVLASMLGFIAMCCQNRSLLIFVLVLFFLLVCFEIAVAALSLYTNSNTRSFIDHLWTISTDDFRLYIEDTWDCCGLFNFTDRPAPPCPLGGSVRACYPSLKTDVNTLLLIVFFSDIAVILSHIAFLVSTSVLAYMMHIRTRRIDTVPLLASGDR